MHFESATRSIVRSIRQRDLLNVWLRVFRRERSLPLIHQFQPDRLEEEKPDLVYHDVKPTNDGYRFVIIHGGQNLVKAFGTEPPEGRFLDELVGAERTARIVPPFLACIESRRPVYTVSAVSDVSGVPVSYERLVLPFGAGAKVQQLIVSLKTISVEGHFQTRDLIRADTLAPACEVSAVIDRDLDASYERITVADDVIEL